MKLIVVDDPQLAAAADRQWSARSEAELEITEWTGAQLREALNDERVIDADAIIYQSSFMGELAELQLISPMPSYVSGGKFAADDLSKTDLFPLVRNSVTRWGETTYAVSLGQPVFVLGYRPDILELVGATPPSTWDALSTVVQQIADFDFATKAAEPPEFVIAQPLENPWAAELLLARATSSAKSRARFSTLFDLRTMKSMIGTKPFVAAFEALVADQVHGADEALQWGPCEAMQALQQGRCAIAIGWPCKSVDANVGGDDTQGGEELTRPVLMAPLPGSRQVFRVASDEWHTLEGDEIQRVTYLPAAGRCGSVVARSRRQRAAWGLLVRLTGREWGKSVASASQSSAIYRSSQQPEVDRWLGESWPGESAESYADAVKESLSASSAVSTPRLHQHADYRQALTDAVQSCLREGESVTEALQAAASSWDEITKSDDAERKSSSYHQSLGLEP